jgi:hypothetical protein
MPTPLEKVLAIKSPPALVDKLSELTRTKTPFGEQPPLIRMFNIAWDMQINIDVYGIERFIFDDTGEFAHEMLAFLRNIGTRETAAYLGAAVELFPRGKVPKDRVARMTTLLEIEKEDPDPLELLDRKYKKLVKKELYPTLAKHMRANAAQL